MSQVLSQKVADSCLTTLILTPGLAGLGGEEGGGLGQAGDVLGGDQFVGLGGVEARFPEQLLRLRQVAGALGKYSVVGGIAGAEDVVGDAAVAGQDLSTIASRSTASRRASRTLGSAKGPSAVRMTMGIAMSLGRRTVWMSLRPLAVRAATAPTLEARSIWPASRALARACGVSKILTSMASR